MNYAVGSLFPVLAAKPGSDYAKIIYMPDFFGIAFYTTGDNVEEFNFTTLKYGFKEINQVPIFAIKAGSLKSVLALNAFFIPESTSPNWTESEQPIITPVFLVDSYTSILLAIRILEPPFGEQTKEACKRMLGAFSTGNEAATVARKIVEGIIADDETFETIATLEEADNG